MVKMLRPTVEAVSLDVARRQTKQVDSFYRTVEWRKLVAEVIQERGRCCQWEGCGRSDGRIFADHVIELKDGGAPLDKGNVMLLCGSHHTKKTLRERERRMRETYHRA